MAKVSSASAVGATPAIQSQCTYLPSKGFTTALSATPTPTIAKANPKEMSQLRFAGPDFIVLPLTPDLS